MQKRLVSVVPDNDFEFIDKLGEGAYSSVYKVKRKADQQFYALKQVLMSGLTYSNVINTNT